MTLTLFFWHWHSSLLACSFWEKLGKNVQFLSGRIHKCGDAFGGQVLANESLCSIPVEAFSGVTNSRQMDTCYWRKQKMLTKQPLTLKSHLHRTHFSKLKSCAWHKHSRQTRLPSACLHKKLSNINTVLVKDLKSIMIHLKKTAFTLHTFLFRSILNLQTLANTKYSCTV